MKNAALLLSIILFLIIFTACPQERDEDDLTAVEVTGEYDLNHGETQDFPDANFSLTFDHPVKDSRCPTDVACVWEGLVMVTLDFVLDGESSSYEFTKHDGTHKDEVTQVGDYTITLLEVNPYPDGTLLTDADYSVKLSIE